MLLKFSFVGCLHIHILFVFCCFNNLIFKPFNPHFPFFSCPWSFFCWLHLLFMNFSSQFLKVCSPFWCVKSQFFLRVSLTISWDFMQFLFWLIFSVTFPQIHTLWQAGQPVKHTTSTAAERAGITTLVPFSAWDGKWWINPFETHLEVRISPPHWPRLTCKCKRKGKNSKTRDTIYIYIFIFSIHITGILYEPASREIACYEVVLSHTSWSTVVFCRDISLAILLANLK